VLRRPGFWIGAGFVVALILAVGGWLAWSWNGTYQRAQGVEADLTSVRDAVAASDWEAALDALPTAAASVDALSAETAGLPWRVLESLPVVGSTATATTGLAGSLDDLLSAALPLEPLGRRVLSGDIRSPEGAVDVAALSSAAPQLKDLAVALELASDRLNAVDVASVREPVASAITELASVSAEYAPTVANAAEVVERMPGLLGASGPRTWLVLLQNPAEARGTGGFVGGFVTLSADEGQLAVESSGTSGDLATTKIPVDGVSEDDRIMWGPYLTSWNDYNLSPHFPLTATQSVAGMKARGVDVDGVIAVDPAVVAAIMRATGPVTVGDRTVTADDVEQFFLVDVYREYPDPVERDEVSMQIVGSVLSSVLGSSPDLRVLADSLAGPVSEGRVRVWSADPGEEDWLAGTAVGGVLPNGPGPVVAVTFNNSAGNKMDAFVATSVDYTAGTCPTAERASSSLRVTLRNDAPTDLPGGGNYGRVDKPRAPEGSTSMLVHLYLPVDTYDEVATIDGEPADMYPEVVGERLAWWVVVDIDRGQERVIEMTFTEPVVPGVEPRAIVQPMAIPTEVNVTSNPAC
jgi:hypothetical protein